MSSVTLIFLRLPQHICYPCGLISNIDFRLDISYYLMFPGHSLKAHEVMFVKQSSLGQVNGYMEDCLEEVLCYLAFHCETKVGI